MNTVKTFAEGVVQKMKESLPYEYQDMEMEVVERVKNNGVLKTGINVQVPGENISPIIYMDELYEKIKKGASIEETMGEIAACIKQCKKDMEYNHGIEELRLDSLKERVTPFLINTRANRELLQNMPHVQIEDLSMVFKVDIDITDKDGHGMIKVNENLMKEWGLTKEEIYEKAVTNMEKYDPAVLTPMGEMIFQLMEEDCDCKNLLEDTSAFSKYTGEMLFILTNESKMYGASALLCPGVLDKISEMMPDGFYILPSSLHETLIVSKEHGMNAKELGQMVRDANKNVVSREEILSDRVYEYDKEHGRIRQVPESIQKTREAYR